MAATCQSWKLITVPRLNHELVLIGSPESVKTCRASVYKMLVTVNVNESIPISHVQYEELSKDSTMKSIIDGISVNATLENKEVKLRGIEADVKEAKSQVKRYCRFFEGSPTT
jgi:hypothetical protein